MALEDRMTVKSSLHPCFPASFGKFATRTVFPRCTLEGQCGPVHEPGQVCKQVLRTFLEDPRPCNSEHKQKHQKEHQQNAGKWQHA